jgi:hypothetical protein
MIPGQEERLFTRSRETKWFPKRKRATANIPIKLPSTPLDTLKIGADPTKTPEESTVGQVKDQGRHGRPRAPVRLDFIDNPETWTSRNPDLIQARPADPWEDYQPLGDIRQGGPATLACERSSKSEDCRAFAILKTSAGGKESHLVKLSSMRHPSFLDILQVYDWSDSHFTVAEYIRTSLLEIILSRRQPEEKQVACLADQVWLTQVTVIGI